MSKPLSRIMACENIDDVEWSHAKQWHEYGVAWSRATLQGNSMQRTHRQ
jgi:hypothetical protein